MLTALQGITAAYIIAAAIASLAAGASLRKRIVEPSAQGAALALRLFWTGLGITAITQLGMLILAATGTAGPEVALASVLLSNSASVIALGALAAYFAYLFTGSRRAIPSMILLYSGVLALATWSVIRSAPQELTLTRWFIDTNPLHQASGIAAIIPAVAALLPAVGGSIAFIVLGVRAQGAARQRGLLVGSALLLWFMTSMVLSAPSVQQSDVAQVALRVTGALGMAAIHLAYHPPRGLQERWGLVPLGKEGEYAARRTARDELQQRRSLAFQHRVRELI